MNKSQLIEIRDVFNDIQKGISNPIKINSAYKHIEVVEGMEVGQQVKIRAISRYCMLNYYEMETQINAVDVVEPEYVFPESYGTVENKPQHSHTEDTVSHSEAHDDLGTFLTREEKDALKSKETGTQFVIEKKRGNPNFGKKK